MISKIIKIYLKDSKLIIIWLVVTGIISSNFILQWTDKLLEQFPQIEIALLGKALAISLLLLAGLFASLFVIHQKLKAKPDLNDYEIINPPGFMKHKKTGAYFCQPCLMKEQKLSELSTIDVKKMLCRCCKEIYEIDYSVLICDAYLTMVHDRSANEFVHKKEDKT